MSWAVGAATVWALLFWLAKSNAGMWSQVAARYSGVSREARVGRKVPETIVIAERGPADRTWVARLRYRQYATTILSVHDDGIALTQIPPFGAFCRPLFLPFVEMELAPTDWMLWREPMAIRMHELPTTDIILGRDTIRWIRSQTDVFPFGLD
ncbi:hypothetical protein [Sphingomonas jaspsi]|uniref:hypothetical protein n=1 Tax=Sphingomonas jaspsi TaxID=392409 RepID=UPI00056BDA38|nr:hypothetical protein [Sphingomonas jaspsi]